MPLQTTGNPLSTFFGKQSKGTVLALSVLLTLIIGIFDYFLPYEISMSLFYTIPILIAAWYADKKSSDLTALVALLATWWTDELTMPPELLGWIHSYRMFVCLFFFLAISVGASAMKARRDLTAAQIELDRKQIELLERSRRLESEIIKISEREQQRIGQDLHDGLCQYLAALTCAAVSLKKDLQNHPMQDALQEETGSATEIAELLKQGVTQARNIARGLSPVHEDEAGLDSALQELASHTSRMLNIECEYGPGMPVFVRDNAAAAHLFRIAQEALNNATRHGGATRVTIAVTEEDGLVILRVTDNGTGLPEAAARSGGMGLKIMDYRARLIGGDLHVGNNPGVGVTVTCTFRQKAPSSAFLRETSPSRKPRRAPGPEAALAA